ncbi:MAG TPA: S26 family signal peptidase, partial [Planctomycetaceae bacterium]|nr:S26 family signal peptidase [Planctomycetaceae bacterium]
EHQYRSMDGTYSIYESSEPGKLHKSLTDPDGWFRTYSQTRARDVTFPLGPDEFLALGDNSPRSKDSRLWANVRRDLHRHAVHRSALVGKAFFIYWPHGVPFLNDGHGFAVWHHRTPDGRKTDYPSFRVPFYPNVERMRRIR